MATIQRTIAHLYDDTLRWNSGYDRSSHGCRAGHYREPPSGDLYGYIYAMRFQNIPISKNATINSATLTFTAISNDSITTVNTKIRGEAADNPAEWPSTSGAFDTRFGNLTTASINWDNIAAWTATNEYASPDITSVIQELVNRAGWSRGNSICLFWDDNDDRSSQVNDACRNGFAYYTDIPSLDDMVKLDIDYVDISAQIIGPMIF